MSLINDALIDLDSRRGEQKVTGLSESQAISAASSRFDRRRVYPFFVFVLFVVLALSLGAFFVGNFDSKKTSVRQEFHPVDVYPVDVDSAEKTDRTLIADSASSISLKPVTASEEIPEKLAIEVTQNDISNSDSAPEIESYLDVYLFAAETALNNDRLMVPQTKSAFFYFNAALRIEPENAVALEGLEKIKARYVQLIQAAHARSDQKRVEKLSVRLDSMLNGTEKEHYIRPRGRSVAAPESVQKPANFNEASLPDTGTQEDGLRVSDTSEPAKMTIREAEPDSYSDIILQYRRLINNDEVEQASSLLEPHAYGERAHHKVIERLFEHYFKYEKYSEIKKLLEHRNKYEDRWEYQSVLLVQRQFGDDAALGHLYQKYQNNEIYEEKTLSLFAGLLSKDKDYRNSAIVYRKLTVQANSESLYWLGLAIAEDHLGNTSDALRAYQYASRFDQHDDEVALFISERVGVLRAQDKVELSQW